MSLMCAYQDCLCVKYPCSRIAFFRLPTDSRRSTWIRNSGNRKLLNISEKAHRFFCENHFRECDIRTQFNRKILTKHAVPIQHTFPADEPKHNYSTPDDNTSEDIKKANAANFVIEHVEDNTDTTHFYEDVTTPNFEEKDINMSERQLENSYTLLDFYIPDDNDDPEQNEEQLTNQDKLENEVTEMYYVETNSNQVDSSTLDMNSDEDVDKSVAESKKQPLVFREEENLINAAFLESTISENVQVTTSNNDYQEDKHFALSLVGYFQRLPKGKKALAKLKILQYLTELEVGLSGNL